MKGLMAVYFGCRKKAQDYLYGDEFDKYHEEGVLTALRPAFSRDQKKKVYVQNKILEDGQRISDWLLKQKGSFYLCGPSGKVPDDVRKAVKESFVKFGKLTPGGRLIRPSWR